MYDIFDPSQCYYIAVLHLKAVRASLCSKSLPSERVSNAASVSVQYSSQLGADRVYHFVVREIDIISWSISPNHYLSSTATFDRGAVVFSFQGSRTSFIFFFLLAVVAFTMMPRTASAVP